MSCGMSSLSVCQPIAVRTPRSAPLPALWPGTWKRVDPRNPYATTALRYGAWGWSGEAMTLASMARWRRDRHARIRRRAGGRAGDADLRHQARRARLLPRHRLLHRHLPADRIQPALGR